MREKGFRHVILSAAAILSIHACANYQPVTNTGKAIKSRLAQCETTPGCREDQLQRGYRAFTVAKALVCAQTGGATCAALSAASLIAKANEIKAEVDAARTEADAEQQMIADALAELTADEIELAADAAAAEEQ